MYNHSQMDGFYCFTMFYPHEFHGILLGLPTMATPRSKRIATDFASPSGWAKRPAKAQSSAWLRDSRNSSPTRT